MDYIWKPRSFPAVYDTGNNVIVSLPRGIVPLLAGHLQMWETRGGWATEPDFQLGVQAAYLLQERLYTPVETITLTEQASTPATPDTGKAVLFLRDNGSGKSELCIVYDDGSVNVIDTQL